MLPEIAVEEFHLVLEEIVAEQLDLAAIIAPPVDAFAVAEALGMTVARDDRLEHRARLVRLHYAAGRSRTSILLAPEPRPERQQWSVAHEIGEHLAAQACQRLGIGALELPDGGRERLANLLANRLLLPGDWFGADGRRFHWDLLTLKQIYATASHELIARRMLDFPTRVMISVYDHNQLTWRRSNVPGQLPPPTREEISCRRRAYETGETAQQENITAWAIHEPDWKREIVRVELNDFDQDL
jgi:Zn-dependent peptidase ImmA (M78 family)